MKRKIRVSLVLLLLIIIPQLSLAAPVQRGPIRQEYINVQGKTYKLPVLMYHHILRDKDIKSQNLQRNSSIISLEQFERQIKYLHDQNFYTASLEELELFLENKAQFPKKTVFITFDDGYLSNLEYAYPILKKYNMRASIFTVGSYIDFDGQEDFNPKKLQFIARDQMDKYSDVFDYQSHSYKHHRKFNGKPALTIGTDMGLANDHKKMEELIHPKYIAYPYGAYNGRVINILKSQGYKLGFTIEKGYVTKDTDPFRIPRFGINPWTSFSDFKKIVN